MTYLNQPNQPTDRDHYLSQLATSDEDVESLLSGGASVDDLCEAGILDDGQEWQDTEEDVPPQEEALDQPPLSPEEVQALLDRCDWFINERYLDAPNPPH
ncbi:hypothetical protein IQ268_16950 [Oculatella sp. LEGE 06141]|uniref:hypothetical protein n=1 Tax=Oculatella sp. LEGE 06141 TaxID=1828648 RepID=UPI00187DF18A|nr:hypothetical protein [Oculatella sp. LEGE 06141]MBE9180253.1 hypothetical protein [Oculatella sp. LEGE 06141]